MPVKREIGLTLRGFALVAVLAMALHALGFCFLRFRYLTTRELVEIAVSYQARDIDELASVPPERLSESVRAFLERHPDCCTITPDDAFAGGPIERLAGNTWVLAEYRLRKERYEKFPADGTFYLAFMAIDPCGNVVQSTGSREREISAKSF